MHMGVDFVNEHDRRQRQWILGPLRGSLVEALHERPRPADQRQRPLAETLKRNGAFTRLDRDVASRWVDAAGLEVDARRKLGKHGEHPLIERGVAFTITGGHGLGLPETVQPPDPLLDRAQPSVGPVACKWCQITRVWAARAGDA